jgi:hypothetical protein
MSECLLSPLMLVATAVYLGSTLMFFHERRYPLASIVAGMIVASFVRFAVVFEFRDCSDAREY